MNPDNVPRHKREAPVVQLTSVFGLQQSWPNIVGSSPTGDLMCL